MKNRADTTVDILLLHGLDNDLVDDIKSFLISLDLTAATVLNLASIGKPQNKRVNYQIKHCGIPLIIATFDQSEVNTKKARPNIYDEIARCQTSRSKDTIVLREIRGNDKVELPSNVEGQLVILEFDRLKLHRLYPELITELKGKGVLRANQATNFQEKKVIGSFLNKFLDQMDNIWEQEFDIASDNIDRNDWFTENKFQFTLDKFFLEYWNVFNSLIREKKSEDELKIICDEAIQNSLGFASEVWEAVADAKMKNVEDLKIKKSKDKKFDKQAFNTYYSIADTKMRDAKRKHLGHKNKIDSYKDAINNLNMLLRKVLI